ncbi:MAG: NAD(P)H-quinone oxidoreductase, partial [Pseudomonadales bacterium]|nr:NAD(P)H-quinone oxidoreductase [Pseudomonadales bacterium]
MKAVHVAEDKSLTWQDADTPVAGPGEILIKVHATAINRADLLQRRGGYPPPPGASPFMGLECAGEVAALGEGVSGFKEGDRVCALLAGGGYAEYAAAPAGSVVPIPRGYSFAHGAALPEVFATAWLNLFMEAGLAPGEKVILHAGASGVGTAGIQLCASFGNPCFVTAGSDSKIDTCIELGAEGGANRHTESFFDKASKFVGSTGAGVILDPVGGAYLEDNLKLLGLNGRLVLIGLMGGSKTGIDLAQLMMKRARVIGSTLRARPIEEKAAVMGQLRER